MAKFYTAVVTVFHEDGTLDYEGNKAVYEHLIQAGSDGIVLMGSTGEFCSMTMEMMIPLFQATMAAEEAVPPYPVRKRLGSRKNGSPVWNWTFRRARSTSASFRKKRTDS